MAEHHQLGLGGIKRKLNVREARTRLKDYEGATNIGYNMGRARRTLVPAQGSMPDQYAWEEKVVYH